jgi:hypothetical protein
VLRVGGWYSSPALLILLGAAIRELFSFWTGHPFDFELWVRLGFGVINGADPYSTLPPAPGLSFSNSYNAQMTPTVAYLPFWPLLTGFMYKVYTIIGAGNRFVYYFLLKQPVIAGDILLGYLLYIFSVRVKPGTLWPLRFWMLSPLSITISGVWGMFDSLAMSFVLLALLSASHARSSLLAGLGVMAKSIPIIYTLPVTFKGSNRLVWVSISLVFPLLLSLLILYTMGWHLSTLLSTLFSTIGKGGQSMSVWDSIFYLISVLFPAGFSTEVLTALGYVWIPAVLASLLFSYKRFGFESAEGLIHSMLFVTLIFLVFKSQVNEQYSIYLLSLGAIDVSLWSPERKHLLLWTTAVAFAFLVANNYFMLDFLAPVLPTYGKVLGSLGILPLALAFILKLALGLVFTYLNLVYIGGLLSSRRLKILAL